MSNITPDGAWRLEGQQWVPNTSGPSAGPATTQQAGPGPNQAGPSSPYHKPQRPPEPLNGAAEINAAAWSHFGPLIGLAVSTVISLSLIASGLAWFGMLIFVIPLVIRLVQGPRSRFVLEHATESLNFQLTWLLVSVGVAAVFLLPAALGGASYLLALPFIIGIAIFMIVVMAKAGSAANRGEFYQYPLTFRFVTA